MISPWLCMTPVVWRVAVDFHDARHNAIYCPCMRWLTDHHVSILGLWCNLLAAMVSVWCRHPKVVVAVRSSSRWLSKGTRRLLCWCPVVTLAMYIVTGYIVCMLVACHFMRPGVWCGWQFVIFHRQCWWTCVCHSPYYQSLVLKLSCALCFPEVW